VKAILTYHSIDDSGSPISLAPHAWVDHLEWLASGRVRVMGLTDLLAHPTDGDDAVAVTFDDGFRNVDAPVASLRARGLPATIFVVTGHVGRTNDWGGRPQAGIPTLPLLSWAELESLLGQGAAVEAHTRTHPHLTRVSPAALADELDGCREDLRARLGVEAAHLAYPYGDVNDAVAGRSGRFFRAGYTTMFRTLAVEDSPMLLPRLDMYYFSAPGALARWGTAGFRRRLRWIGLKRWLKRPIEKL